MKISILYFFMALMTTQWTWSEVVAGDSGEFQFGFESALRPVFKNPGLRVNVDSKDAPAHLNFQLSGLNRGDWVRIKIHNLEGALLASNQYLAESKEMQIRLNPMGDRMQPWAAGFLITEVEVPTSHFSTIVRLF